MADRGFYHQFSGAEVVCGFCGKRATFAERPYGPDMLARRAGWVIQWPGPLVRCPKHPPAAE